MAMTPPAAAANALCEMCQEHSQNIRIERIHVTTLLACRTLLESAAASPHTLNSLSYDIRDKRNVIEARQSVIDQCQKHKKQQTQTNAGPPPPLPEPPSGGNNAVRSSEVRLR